MAAASPNCSFDLWRASDSASPCDCSCSAAVARWSLISAWISVAGSPHGGLCPPAESWRAEPTLLSPGDSGIFDSQDEVHGAGEVGPLLAEGEALLASQRGKLV